MPTLQLAPASTREPSMPHLHPRSYARRRSKALPAVVLRPLEALLLSTSEQPFEAPRQAASAQPRRLLSAHQAGTSVGPVHGPPAAKLQRKTPIQKQSAAPRDCKKCNSNLVRWA